MNEKSTKYIYPEYNHFAEQFKSVILSSVNKDGSPHASYAPFVRDFEGRFYIFVSDLAKHTQNILTNNRVSILFIQNEEETAQPFARQRLTFDCVTELIERDEVIWKNTMSIFVQKFGKFMETLMSLADFALIKIKPSSGIYVKGFGDTYSIKGDNLDQIEHLRSSTT